MTAKTNSCSFTMPKVTAPKIMTTLSVVLLVTSASFSLCACNKKSDDASDPTVKTEKPKVDYKSRTWDENNKDGLAALEKGINLKEELEKVGPDAKNAASLKAQMDDELQTAELALLAALTQAEAMGRKDVRVASTCNNLASVYEQREMYQQCLPLLNRAQKVFIFVYDVNNPAVATVLHSMARVLMKQERFEEAAPILIRVIKIQEANPTTKPDVLQESMLKYSTCLRRMGRPKEAFKWEAAAKQVQTK